MGTIDFTSFKTLVTTLLAIINSLIVPILVTIGIIFFTWNLALYVYKSDNETERANAKTYMLWSIIALFLIFSIWGIIQILRNTVGIQNPLPMFPEGQTTTTTTGLPTATQSTTTTGPVLVPFNSGANTAGSATIFPASGK